MKENVKCFEGAVQAIQEEFYKAKRMARQAVSGSEYYEGKKVGLSSAYFFLTHEHLR